MSVELSDESLAKLNAALRAFVDLDLIEEWEFQTIIGDTKAEYVARLPLPAQLSDEERSIAIVGLGNVLGYPHGRDKEFERASGCRMADVRELLDLLRPG